MNKTKKFVILGVGLMVAFASMFANETNPSEEWALLKEPAALGNWTDPVGTILIEGASFTMGQMSEFVTAPRNSERRTVTVNSFYMDKHEVSNGFWKAYERWVSDVFGAHKRHLVESVIPDSTVWRDEMAYNDPLVEYYYRHKAYSAYPVVGVTWEQAVRFCQWRTDRENEKRLQLNKILTSGGSYESVEALYAMVKRGVFTQAEKEYFFDGGRFPQFSQYVDSLKEVKISLHEIKRRALLSSKECKKLERSNVEEVTFYQIPYEWIKNEYVFNTEKYLHTDYLPIGHIGRKVNMSDDVLLIGYRLPTEAEWEYAALGLVKENKKQLGMVTQGSIYPWEGYKIAPENSTSDGVKSGANFVSKRGDMTGGTSSDNEVVTAPVDAYAPNSFGLYNMAGNVNEWVLDVYRETTHEEVAEYNAFRGNIYTHIVRNENGEAELDEYGCVKKDINMGGDKRDYKDGDASSLLDTDYPLDTTNLSVEQMENVQYDPSDILAPRINSETRVYKGGSWNDRVYWIEPATRRYLDQKKCSSTIGFRCAMSKLGK